MLAWRLPPCAARCPAKPLLSRFPPTRPVQRPGSAAYRWPERLVRLLPWMTLGSSPTFSLDIDHSLVFQELNVAYAFHETVAGGSGIQGGLGWGGRLDKRRAVRRMPRLPWPSSLGLVPAYSR